MLDKPLHRPAKELAVLLQNKVMLERAYTENLSKINGSNTRKQLVIISNEKDMFAFSYGPAIGYDLEFTLTRNEAFNNLAEAIKSHGDRIQFLLLQVPINKSFDNVTVDVNNNVIIRIVEYYEVVLDEILTRYDVLIEKITR